MEIHYHPGKANVVADALSRKSYVNVANATQLPKELCEEFEHLKLSIVANTMELEVEPILEQEIRKGQLDDVKIKDIAMRIVISKALGFHMDDQGTVWFGKRICVLEVKSIRESILREAHDLAYSIHPGSTKMYLDLRERYWWYGLKRDVAEYVIHAKE